MSKIRSHLTYANVVATLALVMAVGGGSVAIALHGKNSVFSDDIKNGQVGGRDLGRFDLGHGSGGIFSDAVPVDDDWATLTRTARCPKGERAINGGTAFPELPLGENNDRVLVVSSHQTGARGWTGRAAQDAGLTNLEFDVYVTCLPSRR